MKLTAKFLSALKMAPHNYYSELFVILVSIPFAQRGFLIATRTANDNWYALLLQEITRLGELARQRANCAWLFVKA